MWRKMAQSRTLVKRDGQPPRSLRHSAIIMVMLIAHRIVVVSWLVIFVYWMITAATAKRSARGGGLRRGAIVRLLSLVTVFFAWRTPPVYRFLILFRSRLVWTGSALGAACGVVLCIAGIAFALWARRTMGNNWGMPMTLKEKPELVTSGPYALVRHPIYSGILIAMIGTVLIEGVFWFIPTVVFLVYFIVGAKTEERLMGKAFPDSYPAYKRRTKMLIPFIL
jgi:protein-S-isoprenylcysteine O-methyltransferase Ste14